MKKIFIIVLLCALMSGCSHAMSSNTLEKTAPYTETIGPSSSSKKIIEIRKYHPGQDVKIDIKEKGKKKYKFTKKNGKIIVEVI